MVPKYSKESSLLFCANFCPLKRNLTNTMLHHHHGTPLTPFSFCTTNTSMENLIVCCFSLEIEMVLKPVRQLLPVDPLHVPGQDWADWKLHFTQVAPIGHQATPAHLLARNNLLLLLLLHFFYFFLLYTA